MFRNKKNITAVDISNSKIRACVAEDIGKGDINILAAEEADLSAVKRSIVIDLGQTSGVLRNILNRIKDDCGVDNRSIYLNVSGEHLDRTNSHGAVMVQNSKGQVTKRDINNVIASAYTRGVSLDRAPIHSLICGYTIDEQDGVLDPINMHAKKLEVDLSIISGISNCMKNLKKAVNQAGYEVKELIASALAASFSVLTDEEKRSGVVLIDLGAGVTDIAFFKNNYLRGFKVIPKGGEDITDEVSKKLKISLSYAEEIKKRYGCVFINNQAAKEDIALKDTNENFKSIDKSEICEIIKKSLKSTFKEIKSTLNNLNCLNEAPCGIVITGGVSLLDGLVEEAQDILEIPVRFGLPNRFKSSKNLKFPTWSTCLGLARYALIKEDSLSNKDGRLNPLAFIKRKIENLLTDYF